MYCSGIYTGAKGTIVRFVCESRASYEYCIDILNSNGFPKEIPIAQVNMDDNICISICTTMPNVIPLGEMWDDRIKYKNDSHRWQLPLRAASATTSHKMQGSTVHGNCVTLYTNISERPPFTRGIDYVCR